MREQHVIYLRCPECPQRQLEIKEIVYRKGPHIETGTLQCPNCERRYSIVRSVPRFVSLDNYASSFGMQWSKHARTQYDSFTGKPITEKRFFEQTGWPRILSGELVLEVGSGSGRFTEQASRTGAMVVSIDYSYAVDANFASNGDKENILIVQGDLYRMPFPQESFDRVFCLGVLQHTPDAHGAFLCLPRYLKAGGHLAVDMYRKGGIRNLFLTKYWVRPITKRMSAATLYKICELYVHAMWHATGWINRTVPFGRAINWRLLVADYRGVFDLPDEDLKNWAVLDTFDMLSPRYDSPQKIETLRDWFAEAGLVSIDVKPGYNGIVGRARKPQ